MRDYDLKRILIVDCDVHQGNGSARIFEDEPRVFTSSFHCEGNLFSKREASDLDVDLPVGSGDELYLETLREHLPTLFERVKPQLVFYHLFWVKGIL